MNISPYTYPLDSAGDIFFQYSLRTHSIANEALSPKVHMSASRPPDPLDVHAGLAAEAGGKSGGVVLDVADAEELVFELGHRVPGEAALGCAEVERVDAGVDHVIA